LKLWQEYSTLVRDKIEVLQHILTFCNESDKP